MIDYFASFPELYLITLFPLPSIYTSDDVTVLLYFIILVCSPGVFEYFE